MGLPGWNQWFASHWPKAELRLLNSLGLSRSFAAGGASQAASAEASVISQTPSQGVQGPGACVILGLAVVLKCGHSSLGRRFQSLLSVGRGGAPGPFLHLELL